MKKLLKYALKLGIPIISLAGAGFVVLHENFYVNEIIITGNNRATNEDIISNLGFYEGEHILLIRKHSAERALEADPRIAWAELRRRSTGRVDVIVREEYPAMLLVAEKIWGITDSGLAIPFDEPFHIPNLTVLTCGNSDLAVFPYKIIENEQIKAGLAFYNNIKLICPQFIDEVSEIRVAETNEITMILTADGLAVEFGDSDPELRIKRLSSILEDIGSKRNTVSKIDLRYADQAIIELSQSRKNKS